MTAHAGARSFARGGLVAYAIGCAAMLVWVAEWRPERHGDGFEYLAMVEAFANHLSPDLRPHDLETLRAALDASGIPVHSPLDAHFHEAGGGARLSWHFWLYPLAAAPVRVALARLGGDPMAALQVLNALCLQLAVGFVLFGTGGDRRRRLLFLGLVLVGPVWWFVRWTHPEVFTWALVVVSISLARERAFPAAALLAALATTHNPPLFFLALWMAGAALRWGDRRTFVLTGLATSVAAVPTLLSLYHFGTPSLIVSSGYAGFEYVSMQRVASLLFDLNQGMLPHVPFLLLLWLATGLAVAIRRDGEGLTIVGLVAPMLLLATTQANWNGGTAGVMRYAIWMIPVMAWAVVDHLPAFRLRDGLIVVAIVAELPIVFARGSREDFLEHSPLAAFVLTHAPDLYSPVPEIFVERTLHREVNEPGELRAALPVVYAASDGIATKVAYLAPLDPGDWDGLAVEPGYLARLIDAAHDAEGVRYDEPPRGALRLYEPDPALDQADDLRLGIVAVPASSSKPRLDVRARLENRGGRRHWHTASTTPTPLNLSYHVSTDERTLVFDGRRTNLPGPLRPGEALVLDVRVDLPTRPGRYTIRLDAVVEQVRWLGLDRRVEVDVTGRVGDDYRAIVRSAEGVTAPARSAP